MNGAAVGSLLYATLIYIVSLSPQVLEPIRHLAPLVLADSLPYFRCIA